MTTRRLKHIVFGNRYRLFHETQEFRIHFVSDEASAVSQEVNILGESCASISSIGAVSTGRHEDMTVGLR